MTTNAWQRLAYSPLGAIRRPLANTYETHQITDQSLQCLRAPLPSKRS